MSALLSAGREPDKANKFNQTPLFLAVAQGHVSVVRQLLQAGASADGAGIELGDYRTLLGNAILNKHVQVVKLLLDRGADPNGQVSSQYEPRFRPLTITTTEGHADMVKILLERGADPDLPDLLGEMVYSVAERKGDKSVMNILSEHRRRREHVRDTCMGLENGDE